LSHGYVTARNYNRYDVNGFRFRTAKLEKSRPLAATVNSGLMTSAYDASDKLVNYYGILQNIVVYAFGGPKELSVTFFECDWFDPRNGIRVDNFGIVEVKHGSKLQGQDDVVLAHQVEQVYYLPYPHPSFHAWWVAFKVNRQVFPPGDTSCLESDTGDDDHDVFQEAGLEQLSDEDEHDVIGQSFHVSEEEGPQLLENEEVDLIEEPRSKRKRAARRSVRIQRLKERVNKQRVVEADSDADDF
jgi:hypothetical protein